MKIAIGSDHAGFELKSGLVEYLKSLGHEVVDTGCFGKESVHYPEFAKAVALEVGKGACDFGVLVCFTGFGMAMAAGRFKGVRPAVCRSVDEAEMTRAHNCANVLVLGAKYTFMGDARAIVSAFLETPFSEGERHKARIAMVEENGTEC